MLGLKQQRDFINDKTLAGFSLVQIAFQSRLVKGMFGEFTVQPNTEHYKSS